MRVGLAIVAASFVALLGGCGGANESTPAACLQGPRPYERALAAAPGTVELEGGTPISGCLVPAQEAGELAEIGEALLEAATKLDAEARAEPGGAANLRLGYLVGAVQRGAEGTEGIHAELVRRLTVAARFAPDRRPLPPGFLRAYREGFDAGRTHG